MLVGILSDTHDRVANTRSGLELLRNARAEFFIHCGDVGGQPILDQLAGLPSALVWGNNDWDRRELSRYAQNLGIQVCDEFGDLTLGEKRFAFTHGDNGKIVQRIIEGQKHDYLLLGHSHMQRDERIGTLRIINPGALERAARKSVAILNTTSDKLQFLYLPNSTRKE